MLIQTSEIIKVVATKYHSHSIIHFPNLANVAEMHHLWLANMRNIDDLDSCSMFVLSDLREVSEPLSSL